MTLPNCSCTYALVCMISINNTQSKSRQRICFNTDLYGRNNFLAASPTKKIQLKSTNVVKREFCDSYVILYIGLKMQILKLKTIYIYHTFKNVLLLSSKIFKHENRTRKRALAYLQPVMFNPILAILHFRKYKSAACRPRVV